MTSRLSFVMFNCEVVTFPLVSWIRCSACLYQFLIFALFLTLLWYAFLGDDFLGYGSVWYDFLGNDFWSMLCYGMIF